MKTVSVIGLGKLGACMAACIAHKGFNVVGVDLNAKTVERVNAGQAPVAEPGLGDLMKTCSERLTATTESNPAIQNSDITFIVVPTPSDKEGIFSLDYVSRAACSVGEVLQKKSGYHLVVLTSTVLPGSTEFGVQAILEEVSGKTCGADFGLCYSPEFIALGSVIRDFLSPDFLLIGEFDERAGGELEAFYQGVCDNAPPVARMNFVNAELAKVAVNTFVTTKITFANMLAEICEELPGGDIDSVAGALGLDSRIGKRYLKGGLGYGGPCFPRDNVALAAFARWLEKPAMIAESTDLLNKQLADRLVEKVKRYVQPGVTVGLLGLSYKPDSDVVEESHAVYLSDRLAAEGADVLVHDPLAIQNAQCVLEDRVKYAGSVEDLLGQADLIVVANPDPAYSSLGPSDFKSGKKPVVVIDCWRILADKLSDVPQIEYIPLGTGADGAPLSARLGKLWNNRTLTKSFDSKVSSERSAVSAK